jgi:natural product biosynthesis luciferase-like monooxygenase protein
MRVSLSFFASGAPADRPHAYDLVLECARIADDIGCEAIWLPERHFSKHGSIFPNPSVLGAALAMVTERVRIRAGSVILPLHDPIRVAEEWAMVDQLSGGRVDLAFATGWARGDFVLAPEVYDDRRKVMRQRLDDVLRLWSGQPLTRAGPGGVELQVTTLPRPTGSTLAIWFASGGGGVRLDTPRLAGELGYNLLTHMVSQTFDDVAVRVAAFRKARAASAGATSGTVTLLMHTCILDDDDPLARSIEEVLAGYITDSLDLQAQSEVIGNRPAKKAGLSERERKLMVATAARRLREDASLIGSVPIIRERIERLESIGVDEIACLVDFGAPADTVVRTVERLAELGLTHP